MKRLVAVAFFIDSLDTNIVNTAVPAIAAAIHVAPLGMKAVLGFRVGVSAGNYSAAPQIAQCRSDDVSRQNKGNLALQSGYVSNFCGPVGPVIEPVGP